MKNTKRTSYVHYIKNDFMFLSNIGVTLTEKSRMSIHVQIYITQCQEITMMEPTFQPVLKNNTQPTIYDGFLQLYVMSITLKHIHYT